MMPFAAYVMGSPAPFRHFVRQDCPNCDGVAWFRSLKRWENPLCPDCFVRWGIERRWVRRKPRSRPKAEKQGRLF